MKNVIVIEHPLAAAKLSILRNQETSTEEFRRNLHELAVLLLVETARSWKTNPISLRTPLRECTGAILSRPIVLVPILRAGLGLLEGMLKLIPNAAIGHIGL